MKLSELTDAQLRVIAEHRPEWCADNRPELLAEHRPDWVEPDLPAEIEKLLKEGTIDEIE